MQGSTNLQQNVHAICFHWFSITAHLKTCMSEECKLDISYPLCNKHLRRICSILHMWRDLYIQLNTWSSRTRPSL